MGTNTPNLSMYKPDPNELVDVDAHLNNNLDAIDQFAGNIEGRISPLESAVGEHENKIEFLEEHYTDWNAIVANTYLEFPPGNYQVGQMGVALAENNRMYFWNGSAWETASATSSSSTERNKFANSVMDLGAGDYAGQVATVTPSAGVYYEYVWSGFEWVRYGHVDPGWVISSMEGDKFYENITERGTVTRARSRLVPGYAVGPASTIRAEVYIELVIPTTYTNTNSYGIIITGIPSAHRPNRLVGLNVGCDDANMILGNSVPIPLRAALLTNGTIYFQHAYHTGGDNYVSEGTYYFTGEYNLQAGGLS